MNLCEKKDHEHVKSTNVSLYVHDAVFFNHAIMDSANTRRIETLSVASESMGVDDVQSRKSVSGKTNDVAALRFLSEHTTNRP